LRVPKLRQQKFETAIIERYKRRESSVEEALIEMYLAGVSVRRVEDITEALWGTKVSPGTVSNLNQKIYKRIEKWRNRSIEGHFPYVYLDGIILKRTWAGEVRNVSVLVATGVSSTGFRKILGVAEGHKEDKAGWSGFLRHLKERGLTGVSKADNQRCLPWFGGVRCRVLSGGKMAALHSAFLPECFRRGSENEDEGCNYNVESHSCF